MQPTVFLCQDLRSQPLLEGTNTDGSCLFFLWSCSSLEVGGKVGLSLHSLPSYTGYHLGECWPLGMLL